MDSDADSIIDSLAARQHGIVSRWQLIAAGVAPHVIDRRLGSGRLRPIYRGVFQVGPLRGPYATEMAAALACGERAVVGHGSCGALWGVLPRRVSGAVDVVVAERKRPRPGLRLHYSVLPGNEVTKLESVPVTTPARTLLDLAPSLPTRELERALAEASALRLTTTERLRKLLTVHPTHRGAARLALVIGGDPALTRSEAEERFLALIDRGGIRRPRTNVKVCGHVVDFFWSAERLVVEVDGFAFHSSAHAFERDRARDAELAAAGLRVVRVTWRQLVEEPEVVLLRVGRALSVGGAEAVVTRDDRRKARSRG